MDWFGTEFRIHPKNIIYHLCDICLERMTVSFIADRRDLEEMSFKELKDKLEYPSNFNFGIVTSLLLSEDFMIGNHDPINTVYHITPKGFAFISTGGYKGRHQRESSITQRKNIENLILLCGSVMAGAYSLLEVCKFFYKKKYVQFALNISTGMVIFLFGIVAGLIIKELLKQRE